MTILNRRAPGDHPRQNEEKREFGDWPPATAYIYARWIGSPNHGTTSCELYTKAEITCRIVHGTWQDQGTAGDNARVIIYEGSISAML